MSDTSGLFSPTQVFRRVGSGTWASPSEELGGMVLLTPTSIAYSGTSASIGANGSVTFTACSSLSLNGVFDATYDNYMIAMHNKAVTGSGSEIYSYRLRNSGSDTSSADFTYQRLDANGTSVSGSRSSSQTFGWFGASNYNVNLANMFYIYGPALAQPTASRNISIANATGGVFIVDVATTHSLSNSYDGITVFCAQSNTGLISVYGLVGA